MRELKDLLNELRETNRLLRNALEETQKEKAVLRQERDNFKEQVDYLTKKLFGSSSEKGACDIPGQMSLFNEAESEMDPAAGASDVRAATKPPESELPENKVKKRRSSNEERFKGIPVKKVFPEPSGEERICSKCGKQMEQIGTELVRRGLKIIPAKAIVIEYCSANYGCKNCKGHGITPAIIKGKDGKAHMVYGMASASTVAWVVYQKYCNGMPLYRTEQDLGRLGAEISRAALANWATKNTGAFFAPVYKYFHRKLLARNSAMADETPVQVLHGPERRAQTKSYMWLFRSGEDGDHPIAIYKYSETRAGDVLHRQANLSKQEKDKLAQKFEDKFINKPQEFADFFNDEQLFSGKTYVESWNFIRARTNSLKGKTNFYLYLKEKVSKKMCQ